MAAVFKMAEATDVTLGTTFSPVEEGTDVAATGIVGVISFNIVEMIVSVWPLSVVVKVSNSVKVCTEVE